MDLKQIEFDVALAKRRNVSGWLLSTDTLLEWIELTKRLRAVAGELPPDTTPADIARISPEALFNRWLGDRSAAVVTAREAFLGARAIAAQPVQQPAAVVGQEVHAYSCRQQAEFPNSPSKACVEHCGKNSECPSSEYNAERVKAENDAVIRYERSRNLYTAPVPAAGVQGDALRDAVRQMTIALKNREWADLLCSDDDAAALEIEIGEALHRVHGDIVAHQVKDGIDWVNVAKEQYDRCNPKYRRALVVADAVQPDSGRDAALEMKKAIIAVISYGHLHSEAPTAKFAKELLGAIERDDRVIKALAAHPAPSSDAGLVEAIRNGIPLEEPVSVAKAMMAHEKARVSLSGGTGPAAAVFLVNIQVQPWTHTAESATAYADGFNRGVEWLRSSILQHAAHPANGAQAGAASNSVEFGGIKTGAPVAPDERAGFEAWWSDFEAAHPDWRYADSYAMRWNAWQAGVAFAIKPLSSGALPDLPSPALEMTDLYTADQMRNYAGLAQRAALSVKAVSYPEIPEGWALVPQEPTTAMMDDAFENISLSDAHSKNGVAEHVWAFMLAAAPTPPTTGITK
ncbi:MAG: hypothetical protein V4641_16355 [Pseudomonadota bacterium]